MGTETRKKGIAIGVEDFKRIIENGAYFVDKTLLIRDLIQSEAQTTLFTRPRRFGKTLNQIMLKCFFEDERTDSGEKIDNGHLFDGLEVSKCGQEIMQHQQQYPVIFISLKSAKQPDFEMAYNCLADEIYKEFGRHRYVLNSDALEPEEREQFQNLVRRKASKEELAKSFAILSMGLYKYHGKKTIILIDEYDVPLENAYTRGFYDQMVDFIRSFFESALKTNMYLEKAVITGCLRISKESIFTGLNNLEIHSITSPLYGSYFGFTEPEVQEMLAYYGFSSKYPEIKKWYDGYLFGDTEIYNPWSILNYVRMAQGDINYLPRAYWSNTSSNSIVHELVKDADDETREELEILMNGGGIEKPVREEITYADIHTSKNNLWNFLFLTGYLKKSGENMDEDGNRIMKMSIPNTEIKTIYRDSISHWFDEKLKKVDCGVLTRALENEDCEVAEDFISQQLMDTISYYDYAENYYHAFLVGLLIGGGGYRIASNRESGNGRPDIVMYTQNIRKGRVIILEVKTATSVADLEPACDKGLAQIEEQHYAEPYETEGYPNIKKYAIAFYKKECMVKAE